MKKTVLLSLLLSITISAQAKEPKKFPLVESPNLVSECSMTAQHFYSSNSPADVENCIHITGEDWNIDNLNSEKSTILRLLEPSKNIQLGNNDVFKFEPYGFIFKDKVKLEVNNASIISPNSSNILNRTFNGPPKVYHVIKYPNYKNTTHYFFTTHGATIVYERKRKIFCDYYISGDGTKFFENKNKGLISANIEYVSQNEGEKIKAFPIDLTKLCP